MVVVSSKTEQLLNRAKRVEGKGYEESKISKKKLNELQSEDVGSPNPDQKMGRDHRILA